MKTSINLKVVKTILEKLNTREQKKMTHLQMLCRMNYDNCKNYVMIMEKLFQWVEIKEDRPNVFVRITELGMEFYKKIKNLPSNYNC